MSRLDEAIRAKKGQIARLRHAYDNSTWYSGPKYRVEIAQAEGELRELIKKQKGH